ncbi:adenylyl-sulfate kinase [Caulobacter sp. RL271]|uniref:Adenylyl-sulfate kinase n=1 Tax=Caulobacter segnis TaxID=88688 RepID=A0ABY4ZR68_9CAUL|nr:adenylyl-sulfate kinase [Caulobacter segnis]USQ95287.1 adenylyl-sulfate kinase [Caulobacter segnis]
MSHHGVHASLRAPDFRACDPGVAYWVTGLPGAGKTTLAAALAQHLEARGRHVVRLDGDRMRALLGSAERYGRADRMALAQTYANFCLEFSTQGFDVVCATVSMFETVRGWNRINIPRYVEIYLRVPIPVLAQRHPKGLYARARAGHIRNVVGVDQSFEEPQAPDLVITDDGDKTPGDVAQALIAFLDGRKEAA